MAAGRTLYPGFGLEVEAIDLAKRPFPADALRALLDQHRLLLFRDSPLSGEGQVELLSVFGEPMQENPNRETRFSYVSNTREDGILGDVAHTFHCDHAFMPDPIEVLSLQAVQAPPGAGATSFVDMVGAAASLPAALRQRVAGRGGHNVIDPAGDPGEKRSERVGDPNLPHSVHPVLLPHARTGQETLFVTRQQTEFIEGIPREESDELLDQLFEHLYDDAHLYVHEWREGDLVVWDNQALQHARPSITEMPRTLRRVSVGGSSVYAFFERSTGPMGVLRPG